MDAEEILMKVNNRQVFFAICDQLKAMGLTPKEIAEAALVALEDKPKED